MLPSMFLQRVRRDLVTEQQQTPGPDSQIQPPITPLCSHLTLDEFLSLSEFWMPRGVKWEVSCPLAALL